MYLLVGTLNLRRTVTEATNLATMRQGASGVLYPITQWLNDTALGVAFIACGVPLIADEVRQRIAAEREQAGRRSGASALATTAQESLGLDVSITKPLCVEPLISEGWRRVEAGVGRTPLAVCHDAVSHTTVNERW